MTIIFPAHDLLDVENSEVTSPLNASEPDSSETCVISGDHSENTEPLSGETQQLSIAFEAACDAAEVSSRPSLSTSGLNRSPDPPRLLRPWRLGWPLFVVKPLTLPAKFPWCRTNIPLFALHKGRNQLVRLFYAKQSRIHATIDALEAEVDLLRASDIGV
ncbi:hypothetical protein Taro_021611 [Colocasia esculenta]|uniref:Uncharacterized protein n=1 Tax=Colocasia esculenta TaxID=4460 RepID=A0A843V2X3_COLES|nr:hypothetical protein [Colocasia esculenta]